MNKSLNVFLSVLLCAVLCVGVLTSLSTTDDSASQYSQKEYTSSIPTGIGAPSVSFGVGARGNDLAVPMSSRRSSREQYLQPSRRSTGVADLQGFARSANSKGMLSHPSLRGGDGGRILTHMSSSQTMKSFGGGSNSAGVSMSGGVVSSNATSSPTNFVSMSSNLPSPLAYYPQSTTSFDGAQLTFAASSLQEIGASAVSYGASAPRGISGRKNGAMENSWLQWLAQNGKGFGSETGDEENGYTYYFNYDQLNAAYEAFCSTWQDMWNDPPSFDEWLAWFQGNGGSHDYRGNTYIWVPVGEYIPLLILALLYAGYIAIRHRKQLTTEKYN